MIITLVLLAGLSLLAILNWYLSRGVREQERVLESHMDRSISELKDEIHLLKIYR